MAVDGCSRHSRGSATCHSAENLQQHRHFGIANYLADLLSDADRLLSSMDWNLCLRSPMLWPRVVFFCCCCPWG